MWWRVRDTLSHMSKQGATIGQTVSKREATKILPLFKMLTVVLLRYLDLHTIRKLLRKKNLNVIFSDKDDHNQIIFMYGVTI